MNRARLIVLVVLAAVIATALKSCNTSGCTENRNAVPLAAFFNSSTGDPISLDSISIFGVGQVNDSVLSAAGTVVSQVYLPMRPTANTVTWCLSYKWKNLDDPRLNDTLVLDYKSTPFFASDECGAYYKYEVDRMQYTDHLIDSVVVVDSLITNVDKVYLNIYFKVASPES